MIYSNGEVIGVLRYVTSTRLVNRQIILVCLVCCFVLTVVLAVVLLSSGYCIRSILNPVAEITEKAQRIASGSYGVQIQTPFKDEIGDLADTINEMSTKIAQNEKMQAEFVSQLSHELRTPLTVINGWSETLLAGDDLNDDTRQGMKIISSEAKRLTEMVMDLLDFTRMQDGRMTLAVEMTDIRGEFEDTVYMYGGRLAQDGIQLVYLDNDEDIPEIPCDPQRMRQVFLNLLDNAAKHGGSGKRIEASMSYDGKDVIVYIRDFGPGIPEEAVKVQLQNMKDIPNSGMVTTMDVGHPVFIHPVDKETVGNRLAYWALAQTYGMKGFGYAPPVYKSMEIQENKIYINFDHAQRGLSPMWTSLKGFEIAGEDKVFHPAFAEIETKTARLAVSSDKVPHPVAVRYAYKNYVEASIFSIHGIPAAPFRTDNW